jgi:FMN hydrolase / 5-amino-6-(5-phospho-D-ribitylamino)uracil phosphatase
LLTFTSSQDTIVKDPFFKEIPAFFNMSMKELLAAKHPTAWLEFERGEISECELFDKFFLDGRRFDGPGLLQSMVNHMVPLVAA